MASPYLRNLTLLKFPRDSEAGLRAHDAGKSVGYATTAAGLVYGSELAIIGVFRTSTPPLYHKYLCMTSIGFLLCGIAISVMLNDKIRFRDQSHRGCNAVYAFFALAIACHPHGGCDAYLVQVFYRIKDLSLPAYFGLNLLRWSKRSLRFIPSRIVHNILVMLLIMTLNTKHIRQKFKSQKMIALSRAANDGAVRG
ncbi:hypothetical protein Tco_1335940 [Tanacetum coccineum]